MPTANSDSLVKAGEVAMSSPFSSDAAEHLVNGINHMLNLWEGNNEYLELRKQMMAFKQSMDAQANFSTAPIWLGIIEKVPSAFKQLNNHLAKVSIDKLDTNIKDQPLILNIAISDEAEFVLGYSSGGENVEDEQTQQRLDDALNSLLAKDGIKIVREENHGLLCKINQEPGEKISRKEVHTLKEKLNSSFEQHMKDNGFKEVSVQQFSYEKAKTQIKKT